MLTIKGGSLQAEPAYKTPLQKQLAECRGAIKLTLRQLYLSRLRIRRQRDQELVERDYIKVMQKHLAALRRHRAYLHQLAAQAEATRAFWRAAE